MAKDLVSIVGKYEKDGETKYKNVKVGVILEKDGKEFALLDPAVNMAGVLAQQNILNHAEGRQIRDSVMCSIFDNSNRQPQQSQQAAPPMQGGPSDDIPFAPLRKGVMVM